MTYLKPSASFAMNALREQCNIVKELRQELAKQEDIRNDLIKDAREPGISISRKNLANIAGVSQQQISNIEQKPYSEYYDGPHYSPD